MRRKHLLLSLLCAMLCVATAFSLAFTMAQAGHDCPGEDCHICARIQDVFLLLRTLACVIVALLFCLPARRVLPCGCRRAAYRAKLSPMRLKVKLSY